MSTNNNLSNANSNISTPIKPNLKKSILKKKLTEEDLNLNETDKQKNIIIKHNRVHYKSLIENDVCKKSHSSNNEKEKKKIKGINESIDIKIIEVDNWKSHNKVDENYSYGGQGYCKGYCNIF